MATCSNCGAETAGSGPLCPACSGSSGAPTGAGDAVSVIIPYKNPKALIGYYLAVFGLIPGIGLLLGPIAVILGILGLRARSRNPQMRGMAHAIVALVLGGIDTLYHVAAIIGIVLAATKG